MLVARPRLLVRRGGGGGKGGLVVRGGREGSEELGLVEAAADVALLGDDGGG